MQACQNVTALMGTRGRGFPVYLHMGNHRANRVYVLPRAMHPPKIPVLPTPVAKILFIADLSLGKEIGGILQ